MVSGVAVSPAAAIEPKNKISLNKKLVKSNYMVSLDRDRHTSFITSKYKGDFFLVDDYSKMKVIPDSNISSINCHHKRKYFKSTYDIQTKNINHYEKLSLITYEGTGVTLMGTVDYNNGTF